MQTLSTEELRRMLERNERFVLINVLPEDDFRKGHIPGSINIPVERDDFVQEVEARVSDRNETVVVYCASETCQASPTAASKLDEAGFTDVFDYEGGMESWKEAEMTVETGTV